MGEPVNHYKVLGVELTATEDEIKRAFRRLAMRDHPDRESDESKKAAKEEAVVAQGDLAQSLPHGFYLSVAMQTTPSARGLYTELLSQQPKRMRSEVSEVLLQTLVKNPQEPRSREVFRDMLNHNGIDKSWIRRFAALSEDENKTGRPGGYQATSALIGEALVYRPDLASEVKPRRTIGPQVTPYRA